MGTSCAWANGGARPGRRRAVAAMARCRAVRTLAFMSLSRDWNRF
jgi:hypothetical protein